jgi:hypothetical protein
MPLMRDAFNDPARLEAWREQCTSIARAQFKEWADRGQPVPLFRVISGLVITLLMHIFMGEEFALAHAEELVPMVRAYESAVQKPQTKTLPRWMSPEGKLLEAVEARFEQLIPEEATKRLENPTKYEKSLDWFQTLVTGFGKENFHQGIVLLPPRIEGGVIGYSVSIAYSHIVEWWTYEPNEYLQLVSPSRSTNPAPRRPPRTKDPRPP